MNSQPAPVNNSNNNNNSSEEMAGGMGYKMTGGMGYKMTGGAKLKTVGTKAMVYHGTAKHTSGGLTKKDLMKTKRGRIVSRKKHAAGKIAIRRLRKAGFKARKGTFKLFKK